MTTGIQTSQRLETFKISPTNALTAKVIELREQGEDVIGLEVGEPDFDTAEHIKAAAIEAMSRGDTKYTAVDGTSELKDAIRNKLMRDNQLEYARNQVIVSCGGKHSIYNLVQAMIDPGDEVIVPSPYWVSYTDIVLLAGGTPVTISAGIDAGFKITPEQLEAAITPRTKLLMLNSPSNPTGVCYRRAEWEALGAVLRKHPQVVIATDDIYERIIWDVEPFSNIVMACPDLYERTVVINGVSKCYAMTGWRIGYAAGPAPIIAGMRKIQSQCTTNPSSISQAAATVALNGDQGYIQEMVNTFKKRHDFVVDRLNQIRGVRCIESQGAFYAFPDFSDAIAAHPSAQSDLELASWLINEAKVAIVPGSAFGEPGYMRLSYATGMETLQICLDRIAGALGTSN
jgi:aspartate aminotransferase